MDKFTWTLTDHNLRNLFGISLDFDTEPYQHKHNHTFYEINIIVRGRVIHNHNDSLDSLNAGDLILIKPAFTHYFLPSPNYYGSLLCINIGINEKIFKSIVESINIPIIKSFMNDVSLYQKYKINNQYIKSILKKALYLKDCVDKQQYNYSLQLKFLLVNVLEAISNSTNVGETTIPSWLNNFLDKLNNPEVFHFKLDELYKFSNYSRNYLCPLFKKYMGVTLQHYFDSKKMDYAAYLLKYSDESISNIASKVGFSTQGHFSILFKKTNNCTPSQYRQNWHKTLKVQKQ